MLSHNYKYFLVNEEDDKNVTRLNLVIKKFKPVLLVTCLCVIAAGLGFIAGNLSLSHKTPENSPATFKVDWEPHTFRYNRSFSEAPSNHTDRAWREIFPKKGGFFVHPTIAPTRSTFSVFHQLHCVDGLRGAYWANHDAAVRGIKLVDEELPMDIQPSHIRHCFDLLRQSLMCHADTTIEVVDEKINGVHGFRTEHQCGNWQQLVDWTSEQQMKKPVEQIVKE